MSTESVHLEGLHEVAYQRKGEILKCPWHLWGFDVKIGKALHDEAVSVRTYTVQQEGDEIVVYMG